MSKSARHRYGQMRASARHSRGDAPRSRRLRYEPLEKRDMLSASGGLSAPEISLPTQPGPLNGGGTIDGIWLSDPGSNQIAVTLSVEHGTLVVGGGNGSQDGITISGDGTSSVTVTGSE